MKSFFLTILLITLFFSAFTQTPQKINYQTVVRNNQGTPIANGTAIQLKFSIHDGSPAGTVVFTEIQNKTSNQFGLVTAEIGSINNLNSVNWGSGTKFLQVEVNINNSTFVDMGTSQMLSVPYALFSGSSATGPTGATGATGPTGVTGATGPTGANTTHQLGERFGGGIVFYVYDGGQHGLIAATSDVSAGVQWYNGTYRYTGAAGDGVGAGFMNTALIVATQISDNQPANFAARLCAGYSVNEISSGITFGEWYLPSQYELNLLFAQRNLVGGFAAKYYWSSTEYGNDGAWARDFSTGNQGNNNKLNVYAVRAIRSF